jgi:septum formation protein
MKKPDDFILASASPRRLDLLKQIGFEPTQIVPAEIDETPHKDELPREYVVRIAKQKARIVQEKHPTHLILAADTVVTLGRRILPKAETIDEARSCLKKLSGRRHTVMTCVVVSKPDAPLRTKTVETVVQFKRLHETEIAWYLESGEWKGKAGGYAIQGLCARFIPSINGSYSNVVGLPLAETVVMLTSM